MRSLRLLRPSRFKSAGGEEPHPALPKTGREKNRVALGRMGPGVKVCIADTVARVAAVSFC